MRVMFLFSHAAERNSILCAQVQRNEIVAFSVLDSAVWTVLIIQLWIVKWC